MVAHQARLSSNWGSRRWLRSLCPVFVHSIRTWVYLDVWKRCRICASVSAAQGGEGRPQPAPLRSDRMVWFCAILSV